MNFRGILRALEPLLGRTEFLGEPDFVMWYSGMAITKRDIKEAFAEFKATGHEMSLVDYPSSGDESTTRAQAVHLNPMSLNFMLNDPQTTVNTEDVASNVVADNDQLVDSMNITASTIEKDSMDIPRRSNEEDITAFTQNSVDNTVIAIEAERLRRETLLKRITGPKDAEGDSNSMGDSNPPST
jgi:hypothetical protein